MEFKKYISLENHYQQKYIDIFLEIYPELKNETYIIQEKIHGANIQLDFDSKGNFKYGKRTSFVEVDQKFYNIHNVIKDYDLFIQVMKDHAVREGCELRIYGELYGSKVQKGVDYGIEGQKLLFFDASVNGLYLTPREFISLMTDYGFKDYVVPTVEIAGSLQEALDCNTEFSSLVNPIPDNICEGVVIKPYNKQYFSPVGSIFYIKKKNEKFKEINKPKDKNQMPKKPLTEYEQKALKLNKIFKGYITKNRIEGIFSKYGEIEEPKQISEYIKYVLEDAKEDFLKDHEIDFEVFNKKEEKMIFNVGSMIPLMLKEYL